MGGDLVDLAERLRLLRATAASAEAAARADAGYRDAVATLLEEGYGPGEVAEVLDVSRWTVYRHAEAGDAGRALGVADPEDAARLRRTADRLALKARRQAVAAAAVCGKAAVGRAVGVSRHTVRRWVEEEAT